MSEEPAVLVCALATAPRVVPGSIFHRHCAVCGRSVMIAPSGQRMLAASDDLHIICYECFIDMTNPGDEVSPAAGTMEEMLDEARRSQPNLRGSRN